MKLTTLFAAAAMATTLSFTATAQNPDAFKIMVGGSFAKPKIIPHAEKLAIAQFTVSYKLTSTLMNVGKEKSSGKMAGARITSYLETSDGDLTAADFQEITDYGYRYFQQQLKANNIDTIAWSMIAATEFYKDNDDKDDAKVDDEDVKMTYNANRGARIYGGGTAFAFGKAKRASNFADEIGAPAAYFHLTVDFADLAANVSINSGRKETMTTITTTEKKTYSSSVAPRMKVTPTGATGLSLFWGKKNAETLVLQWDIPSDYVYHTSMTEDPSRIKNRAFAFAKSMKPVVIETTKAQYKAAAKKALEKYADTFIALTKK